MEQLVKQAQLPVELQQKYERLCGILAQMGDIIVGMSGGVDSVLLARVAHDVLGDKALAVTADSPLIAAPRAARGARTGAHQRNPASRHQDGGSG